MCPADSSEKTVYLIAGWSFTPAMWTGWLQSLAGQWPGALRWVPLSAEGFAAWMTGDASHAPDGSPLIPGAYAALGWSLGGSLLAESVIRQRWRPEPACVVSASPRFLAEPQTGWPGVSAVALHALRRQVLRDPEGALAQFDQWLRLPVEHLPRERDPAVLCAGLDWLARLDHRPWVEDLPLRWLCGGEDPLVPEPGRLPKSATRVSAAGHGLPFTHPDRLLAELMTHD
ncbi:hypothetical protein [Halothiobacillus sp. DCM-1]|uniref:hypothetical protein n=1 Tax=Halothiobacillus sp. DCM-1 TaxID=3112558 RepID=UPI003248C701